MFSSSKYFAACAAAVLVAGCATDRSFGGATDIEVTDLAELPAPGEEVYFKIGPLQPLKIEIVGSEELSGEFLTDGSGDVDFPFLGTVETGGRSPNAAAAMIADGLRGRFLRDPQVRIVIEDLDPPSISVGGEVKKPGNYPALHNATLLRMINAAEGVEEFAQLDDVLVLRAVGGQKYIGIYSLAAIQRGNYADPILYPNDIVLVGDSPARRRLASIFQFLPLLTSSAIIIDRLGSP